MDKGKKWIERSMNMKHMVLRFNIKRGLDELGKLRLFLINNGISRESAPILWDMVDNVERKLTWDTAK